MFADPLLQEIIEESRLEIACGWKPSLESGLHTIYTDGCCLGNGKEGARAGYGIYVTDASGASVFSGRFKLPETDVQTNQRAELTALLYALNYAGENTGAAFEIYSDSRYAIDCVTRWGPGWEAGGWRKSDGKPVLHSDLIRSCVALARDLGSCVKIYHIEAHTGGDDVHSRGNAVADRLSREGAELKSVT
jgi:ribonuclease HI